MSDLFSTGWISNSINDVCHCQKTEDKDAKQAWLMSSFNWIYSKGYSSQTSHL